MATKEQLHQLVGRLMSDPKLYKRAQTDPVAAAKETGIPLTADQEKWLASKPEQFHKMMSVAGKAFSPDGEDCQTCIVDGH